MSIHRDVQDINHFLLFIANRDDVNAANFDAAVEAETLGKTLPINRYVLRVSQIRRHTVLPKLVKVVHTSRYTRR